MNTFCTHGCILVDLVMCDLKEIVIKRITTFLFILDNILFVAPANKIDEILKLFNSIYD